MKKGFSIIAKKLILGAILSINSFIVLAQSQIDLNYIQETTVTKKDITNTSALNTLSIEEKNVAITYVDGLGNIVQLVQLQASPQKKDIIQPIVYDLYQREPIKYLPYVSDEGTGKYRDAPVGNGSNYNTSPQYQFYQSTYGVAHDLKPYSTTIFENSPINRIIEQGATGESWQPGASQGATVKFNYFTNIANEVQLWEYIPNTDNNFGNIKLKGNYSPNTLLKTQTTDEHQNTIQEFKDLEGKLILKKILNGEHPLYTYYIYDDFNLLRAVIQPQGFAEIPSPLSNNYILPVDFINKWCFTYNYDAKQRMIEKKVPGVGKEIMLYNKRDRVVLSQDAVQRGKSEWTYTKYDAFNRPVIVGKLSDVRSISTIQASIDAQSILFEVRQNDGVGYSFSNSYPSNADTSKIISLAFYDDYNFLGNDFWDKSRLGYAYLSNDLIPVSSLYENANGLITGTKIRVLKRKGWEYKVNYYDVEKRVIQSISKNFMEGKDITSSQYDFTGKLLAKRLTHTGVESVGVNQSYEYDHLGRLLRSYHQIGNMPKILLAENKYNPIGQLVEKGLGVKNDKALQSIDYRYNIRGWITSINNSALNNDGILNNDDDDVFGMELLFEKPLNILGLDFNKAQGMIFPSLKLIGINNSLFASSPNTIHYPQKVILRLGINKTIYNNLEN